MTSKPTAPRSAPPRHRKVAPDDRPMRLKDGTPVNLRAPWPFPISIGKKKDAND